MIYLSIGLFAAFWGLLYLMRRDTLKRGELSEKNKDMEGVLDDVRQANLLRDKLNDPAVNDVLYHRFERKK